MSLFFLLLLFGCDNNTQTTLDVPVERAVYHIGVLAPLDAGQTEFGRGILNSVLLAVAQWNEAHSRNGPLFRVLPADDSSTPAVGQAAAQQLAQDPRLVGVVGTYNSGVAAVAIPIFDAANIAMISPGNTDPTLTLGPDPDNPMRPNDNYFRLVVPDSLQGPALAEFAFNELGITQVAVVTESKAVSQGLADDFSARFIQLGGTILITEVVPEGTQDYTAILANVAPTNPPLLFYAGEIPNASTVRTQATQAGIMAPLMGGDGVKAQAYIDAAGVITEGDIASSLGAPAELLPSAAPYLAAYDAAGFTEPPSPFGPYAYDAANLLMAATEAAQGQREGILDFLDTVDTQGVTGRLSFDQFGDTLNKVLTMNRVEQGEFVPVEIVTIP